MLVFFGKEAWMQSIKAASADMFNAFRSLIHVSNFGIFAPFSITERYAVVTPILFATSIYGPTNETLFVELIDKCVFAEKIPFKWLLQTYTLYLHWWEFLTTPESEYVWKRIKSREMTAYQDGFKAYNKFSTVVPAPSYTDEEGWEAIQRAKGHLKK